VLPGQDLQTSSQETASSKSTLRSRLKLLWSGMTSPRHDVRMYKDLLIAPEKVSTAHTHTELVLAHPAATLLRVLSADPSSCFTGQACLFRF